MSEKLQRWALVAEITGGVAIVITLGIVAFELDQSTDQAVLNTSALEISSYQDLISNIAHLNEMALESDTLRNALTKAIEDPETLTEDEYGAVFFYCMSIFRHGDMAYFQYERGAIDEERLISTMQIMMNRMQLPFFKEIWESQKFVFVDAYVAYVDEMRTRMPARPVDF